MLKRKTDAPPARHEDKARHASEVGQLPERARLEETAKLEGPETERHPAVEPRGSDRPDDGNPHPKGTRWLAIKLGSQEESRLVEVGNRIVAVNRASGELTIEVSDGDAGFSSPRAYEPTPSTKQADDPR